MLRQLLSASSLLSLPLSEGPRLLCSPTHDTRSREFPHSWQSLEEVEPVIPLKKKKKKNQLEEGSSHPLTYLSVCLPMWSLLHFWLQRLFLSVTLRLLTRRRMGQKSSFQSYLTVICRLTGIVDTGGRWDLTFPANMVTWMIILRIFFFFISSGFHR